MSDDAVRLYLGTNFDKVFTKYDMAKNGKIDDFEQQKFIRELLESNQ